MGYVHANINFTRWLLGVAFTFERRDWAIFFHLGPICIGIHRDNYYEDEEQK